AGARLIDLDRDALIQLGEFLCDSLRELEDGAGAVDFDLARQRSVRAAARRVASLRRNPTAGATTTARRGEGLSLAAPASQCGRGRNCQREDQARLEVATHRKSPQGFRRIRDFSSSVSPTLATNC